MKSTVVVEIESDGEDKNVTIKVTSHIANKGSELHKKAVRSTCYQIDKLLSEAMK
jgi:hypothetical protein